MITIPLNFVLKPVFLQLAYSRLSISINKVSNSKKVILESIKRTQNYIKENSGSTLEGFMPFLIIKKVVTRGNRRGIFFNKRLPIVRDSDDGGLSSVVSVPNCAIIKTVNNLHNNGVPPSEFYCKFNVTRQSAAVCTVAGAQARMAAGVH